MRSFSYMFLLCAVAVVVLSGKEHKETRFNLKNALILVLKDPEFKALHRYEQYTILEAAYLMFAVEKKFFSMSEYKSNKNNLTGIMKQSKPDHRMISKSMIQRFR